MNPVPLKVFACTCCAATYFPGRRLCAACGSPDFRMVESEHGWIEQWTEVHQSVYNQRADPLSPDALSPDALSPESQARHYLATVRTTAGPLVIAAMEAAGATGMAVMLCHEGERLMARPISPQHHTTGALSIG